LDLSRVSLEHALLTGAQLQGAIVAEGIVLDSVAGAAGGFCWYALAIAGHGVILRYGCDRADLGEWRCRGPEYGARHRKPPEHWETGPAVAIAAAAALYARAFAAPRRVAA
jgi:hypothetical protein